MSTTLMAILMLPAFASATHITNVVGMAECDGFSASVDVHFRSNAEYLDLAYTVEVLDADMNVVHTATNTLHVVKGDDADITVMIDEAWNTLPDGTYTIRVNMDLTSPYPGGVDTDTHSCETTVDCGAVANDVINFESLKALYR
ncbi:hypothetical protein CSB20_00140 [bacterium DOLZORAL124_64_63]|nr:MAG: hypothetical protein CSB20_00140 [bacterium DOLZORAL124_64_63]